MEFNQEKNTELIKNPKEIPTDIVELYTSWLSLLNEYAYLNQTTCPERVAYRQHIASLLPQKITGLADYIASGLLNAELDAEITKHMPFTAIKHHLKPLEMRITNLQLAGLLYEQKVWDAIQSFDFGELATGEFNLIAELGFTYGNKGQKMYEIRELRRICKDKFAGKVKIKSVIFATTARLEANLPPVYAQMLRHIHIPNKNRNK